MPYWPLMISPERLLPAGPTFGGVAARVDDDASFLAHLDRAGSLPLTWFDMEDE